MKRIIAALATTVVIAGGGAAIAAAATAPEVDGANASIQLASSPFVAKSCAGEDGMNYETWRGTWKGGETDLTPGSTDYSLTGNLTIKKVVWTVNLSTDRGVLRGLAVLTGGPAAPITTYTGPVTLITQGLPGTPGAVVSARGWIDGSTFTNATRDGGSLLANVELQVGASFAANGEFGNGTMSFPDFSAVTNNQVC